MMIATPSSFEIARVPFNKEDTDVKRRENQ
jgi:hypothetical protein